MSRLFARAARGRIMGVAVQKKSQYLLTLDKSVPYHALWQLKREHPPLELKLFAGLSDVERRERVGRDIQ